MSVDLSLSPLGMHQKGSSHFGDRSYLGPLARNRSRFPKNSTPSDGTHNNSTPNDGTPDNRTGWRS